MAGLRVQSRWGVSGLDSVGGRGRGPGDHKPATGASAPVWSPDGSRIAFVSSVYPEFSDKSPAESERLNRERIQGLEKGKVKARVYDALPVRKWDAMNDGRRNHLFVVSVSQGAAVGAPVDLTPGAQDAVPWSSTFAAGDEFDWSADSKSLVHTPSPAPVRRSRGPRITIWCRCRWMVPNALR